MSGSWLVRWLRPQRLPPRPVPANGAPVEPLDVLALREGERVTDEHVSGLMALLDGDKDKLDAALKVLKYRG